MSEQPSNTYLSIIRSALAERYAVPVIRVDQGVVCVPAGHAVGHARAALVANAGCSEDEADAIVQPIIHDELAWWHVPAAGITMWRQHGQRGDFGEIVTQLEAGDPPVQVVAEHASWALVRTVDGASGWVHGLTWEHAEPALEPAAAPSWPMPVARLDSVAFVECAMQLLDAPYLWGGTLNAGIDCSGLVQRCAWRASGVWLPRHSTALLRIGARAPRAAVVTGDVFVLKRKTDAPPPDDGMPASRSGPSGTAMHVAIAIDDAQLVHASRDAWRVIVEPREQVEQRYQVLSIRRMQGAT